MKTRRRRLLVAIAGGFAAPAGSLAQHADKIRRIGFLYLGSRQSAVDRGLYGAFLHGMRELGYVEGKHFIVDARFVDGKYERLPELVEELVRSKVEVIVATGTPVYSVLQQATRTIPIVVTVAVDPVAGGIATSLARPGGNFTGISLILTELFPKHVELLKAALPELSLLAVLSNPGHPGHPPVVARIESVAQKLQIQVLTVGASTSDQIERGFTAIARKRAQAVIVLGDVFFAQQFRQIAQLAMQHRLASTYTDAAYPESGGLLSYGPSFPRNFQNAARFVDKILKGAKAGDLPFEEPTKLDLVINRRTAKAMGLAVPGELLLRADRVIE